MTTTIVSYVRRAVGDKRPVEQLFCLGQAFFQPTKGWKFHPRVSGREPSRKFHATLEACLPRWLGYPDSCESYYTRFRGAPTSSDFCAPAPELEDDITSELLAALKQIHKNANRGLRLTVGEIEDLGCLIAKAEGRA